MDSVYDAAIAHAEKLKAELETLQNFLNLHDHFRDHFGLTPPAAPSPASSEAAQSEAAPSEAAPSEATASAVEAPVVDEASSTHEIHVQAPAAEVEHAVESHAPEVEASEPESSEPVASLHAEPEAEASLSSEEKDPEEEPLVIQASEGVLIAATSETAASEPLGPEATLQSVAEKLAATISASHPAVTGYTV